MTEKREWKSDPIPKFGDLSSVEERAKRHLPATFRHSQGFPTPEITLRREVDEQFRIKKVR